MLWTQQVNSTMRIHKQSSPRYSSRLSNDRDFVYSLMLLLCSSSLFESESLCLDSRSSSIQFLVLFACSLVNLSLTCNKVSLHFLVVRLGMWQRKLTRQDTRPKTRTLARILRKAVVRQLVLLWVRLDQGSELKFWSELIFLDLNLFSDLNLFQNL